MKEEIVMYNSPEAAKRETATGWRSRDGRFWADGNCPEAEHMARYGGCTHRTCPDCGGIHRRSSFCGECHKKKRAEKAASLPVGDWDGDSPLCLWDDDKFFWSACEVDEYLEENEIDPADVVLALCEKRSKPYIDLEWIYGDYLCDGFDVPDTPEIREMVKALDAMCHAEVGQVWEGVDVRVDWTKHTELAVGRTE